MSRIDQDLHDQLVSDLVMIENRSKTIASQYSNPKLKDSILDIGRRAKIALDRLNAAEILTVIPPPVVIEPDPVPPPPPPPPIVVEPAPEPEPTGEVPPKRVNVIENAPDGTVVKNDTYYLNPQGRLSFPNFCTRVTVVGARHMPGYVKGWVDVWIEGTPTQPMNLGPATNQDLMQIKREPDGVLHEIVPENITFRYFRMHDLTRTDSTHTDGLQLMCGRRIRFLDGVSENVSVQPYFCRDAGASAGGGPIEDILFKRITVKGGSGYYTFRISGDDEAGVSGRYVPTRVIIEDCKGDKNYSIDAAAANLGCKAINYQRI